MLTLSSGFCSQRRFALCSPTLSAKGVGEFKGSLDGGVGEK
jgi:hypothetical protein